MASRGGGKQGDDGGRRDKGKGIANVSASNGLLCTCPNHLSRASRIFSAIGATPVGSGWLRRVPVGELKQVLMMNSCKQEIPTRSKQLSIEYQRVLVVEFQVVTSSSEERLVSSYAECDAKSGVQAAQEHELNHREASFGKRSFQDSKCSDSIEIRLKGSGIKEQITSSVGSVGVRPGHEGSPSQKGCGSVRLSGCGGVKMRMTSANNTHEFL
ncbi:hypothetical protein KSP39_PZI011941 [Platanthera zijinensis]|uniref:Uncharacterized protein n=1 Tax=Platanthera zijinensis TaxID=2320716 RepID=A0AAP0BH17_9ASPA